MDPSQQQIVFEAPPPTELDRLFSGYAIERLIAQGGMGAVYLGNQTSLDRPVAIKILPKEFGDDPTFREAFQTEARTMAKINNPHLIQVYDFGSIQGMLYIIMEYAEGGSLFELSQQEKLDHVYVGKVGSEIAFGLAAAHEVNILHRDIKPSNILLNLKNEAKISDFGLARPAGTTESGVIYGTPGYTAPEVIKNPEAVDIQADIYSVGVMIYELLTKSLPKKAYMPVNALVGAKPDFDNIIRKAIHPSPKMRYRTSQALGEDLRDLYLSLEKERGSGGVGPRLVTGASTRGASAPPLSAPSKPRLRTSATSLKAGKSKITSAQRSPVLGTAAVTLRARRTSAQVETPVLNTAEVKLRTSGSSDSPQETPSLNTASVTLRSALSEANNASSSPKTLTAAIPLKRATAGVTLKERKQSQRNKLVSKKPSTGAAPLLSVASQTDSPAAKLSVGNEAAPSQLRTKQDAELSTDSSANPLLTPASAATGRNVLATDTAAQANVANANTPAALAPPKQFNKVFFVNLIIIAILAGSCLIAWEFIQRKEAEAAAQRARNDMSGANKPDKNGDQGSSAAIEGSSSDRPKTNPRPVIDIAVEPSDTNNDGTGTIDLKEKERTSHEKALEQLEAEKLNLLNGIINVNHLPANTITRGDRFFLYINKPMTWHEADAFCNTYGGQIATCPKLADAHFLRKAAKANAPFWLGGGSTPAQTISQVDGDEFTLDLDRINDMKGLYYQDFVNAGMKYGNEKLTFFIQWNVEGDMHSTLDDRLIRVYPTLDQLNPDFPPLTFGKGDRRYTIANQPMTFEQATTLARMAGGHLAVISDEEERDLLTKYLARTLSPNVQCWVGTKKSEDQWINVTVESEINLFWAKNQPSENTYAAMQFNGETLEHVAHGKNKLLNAAIIEWSQDEYQAYRDHFVLRNITDINSLKDRTQYVLALENSFYNYQLGLGPKRLAWTIRTWKNGATREQRKNLDGRLTSIINSFEDETEIPASFDIYKLPEPVHRPAQACLRIQKEVKNLHQKQIKTIRDGFLLNLNSLLDDEPRKDSPRAREILLEIKRHEDSPTVFENLIRS